MLRKILLIRIPDAKLSFSITALHPRFTVRVQVFVLFRPSIELSFLRQSKHNTSLIKKCMASDIETCVPGLEIIYSS